MEQNTTNKPCVGWAPDAGRLPHRRRSAAFLTYQNVSQYFSPEQSASSQQPESKAESTQQAGNTVSGVKETVSSASSSEARPLRRNQSLSSPSPR